MNAPLWPSFALQRWMLTVLETRSNSWPFSDAVPGHGTSQSSMTPLFAPVADTSSGEARLAAAGIVVRGLEATDAPSIRAWLETRGGSWSARKPC